MALADELPSDAFTDESLKEMAAGCEFFPNYKVLVTSLRTWLELHPVVPRIANVSPDFQAYLDEQENNQAHKSREADRDARCRADWSDRQKIRESIEVVKSSYPPEHALRLIMGKILGNVVRVNAPENLGHLPAEWQQPLAPEKPDPRRQMSSEWQEKVG